MKRALIKRLKELGFWYKSLSSSRAMSGLPDIVCIRNARVIWIEAKRPGDGALSELQDKEFTKMRKRGAIILIGDDAEILAREAVAVSLLDISDMEKNSAVSSTLEAAIRARRRRSRKTAAPEWRHSSNLEI